VGNGNTNFNKAAYWEKFDWDTAYMNKIDFRLFFTGRPETDYSRCRWVEGDDAPGFYKNSSESGVQICYTSEALKYA